MTDNVGIIVVGGQIKFPMHSSGLNDGDNIPPPSEICDQLRLKLTRSLKLPFFLVIAGEGFNNQWV